MSALSVHTIACESPSGPHQMRVLEWGDMKNPDVVICVHGLTRSAFDFFPLADHLSSRYRVLCPHIVGRGDSSWLIDPSHYHLGQYALDMQAMAHQLELGPVHWVGTSMGGLIALTILGHPEAEKLFPAVSIQSLVLNDVGAVISGKALSRIGQYVGVQPVFESFERASAAARILFESFGSHTDDQWDLLTASVVRPLAWHQARCDWQADQRQRDWAARTPWCPDPLCFPRSRADLQNMAAQNTAFQFHYDPGIAEPFRLAYEASQGLVPDMMLWSLYDAVRCPTLILRGEHSDLLMAETVTEMCRRGPRARALEVPKAGHAPSLFADQQIKWIAEFIGSVQ